jgi:hypothetical protein
MPKKDNRKVQATQDARELSHMIREGRKNEKAWKAYVAKKVEKLRAIYNDEVDITLVTPADDEVASITETEPSFKYDYDAYFAANPAAFSDLDANYRKPPTTQVRVTTTWVEASLIKVPTAT